MLDITMTIATMARIYITISSDQTVVDTYMRQLEGQLSGEREQAAPTDEPSQEVASCLSNLLSYLVEQEIDLPNHFFIPGEKRTTVVLLVHEDDEQKIIAWFKKVAVENGALPPEEEP